MSKVTDLVSRSDDNTLTSRDHKMKKSNEGKGVDVPKDKLENKVMDKRKQRVVDNIKVII